MRGWFESKLVRAALELARYRFHRSSKLYLGMFATGWPVYHPDLSSTGRPIG